MIINRLFLIFVTLFCICLIALPAQAKYSGGTGEPNNAYKIAMAEDMNDIGNHVEDFNKCFVLMADINLADYTGTQFNIIGTLSNPFAGVFDGNGHTISNFTYESTGSNNIGLFSYTENAEIKDLILVDPNVDAGTGDYVGTFVGWMTGGKVLRCRAEGGSVSGTYDIGGLVGEIVEGAMIVNCSSSVNVSGDYEVGGCVGLNSDGTISNCYATGSVEGILNIGGLLGINDSGAPEGMVVNSYALGNVSGDDKVGGLIGKAESHSGIFNCYAAGKVSGNSLLGGLVGQQYFNIEYTKCFWDSDVNPSITGIGDDNDPNVIAKTTVEMMQEATFVNWDFVEVWGIGENQTYPFLRVYPAGDLNHDGIVNFVDVAILAGHWLEDI